MINLKKIGLELEGKSPNVIFADADFERAVFTSDISRAIRVIKEIRAG